jgi:hypothetical protein
LDPIGSILAYPEDLNVDGTGYDVEGIGYDFIPVRFIVVITIVCFVNGLTCYRLLWIVIPV